MSRIIHPITRVQEFCTRCCMMTEHVLCYVNTKHVEGESLECKHCRTRGKGRRNIRIQRVWSVTTR